MNSSLRLFAFLGLMLIPSSGIFAQNVSGFSPQFGSVGDQVVISGSGFSPGTVVVRFNGIQDPSPFVGSAFSITAHVPVGATTGPISVQVNGGTPASSALDFTVIGAGPYITDFSPASGSAGLRVFVNGVHLSGVTNVYFNGRVGTSFIAGGEAQVSALAPAGVTTGPISVRAPNGTNTTTTNFFVAPVISGFSPTNGRPGTNVVITGTNFLNATAVLFGSTPASPINVLSNGAIQVQVPAGADTGKLRVTAPAGSFTTTSNFFVQPTIFSFSPAFGGMNTSVTILGANLAGTTSVSFNGTGASFTGVSFGQLTAIVPLGASSGPITIVATNGTASSTTNFYVPATITGFTPTNSAPGTRITITGTSFTNATAVSFNGIAATSFQVTNNTTIGATVPAGVVTGPISVTTPAGTVVSAGRFYGPSGITSFTPTHGLPGTNVTITGSNFLGATAVKFNGTTASFTPPANNTTIVATVPAGAQTGPITVITPASTNVSAANFVLDYTSDVLVTVNDAPDPVIVGTNLVYTITVFNNGPFNASGVTLVDTLPASVTLLSAVTSQGTLVTGSNPITGNLGNLNIGSQAIVTLTVAPQTPGTITNVATVTSAYPDSSPVNNTNSSTTTVLPLPLLSIQLSAPDRVRLSWPVALTNFVLQSKTNLTALNSWSNVTTVPIISGSERVVTETNSADAKFYRLKN